MLLKSRIVDLAPVRPRCGKSIYGGRSAKDDREIRPDPYDFTGTRYNKEIDGYVPRNEAGDSSRS